MAPKVVSTRSCPVHQQVMWRRTAAGLPCTSRPWAAQRRKHWEGLRELLAVLHSPRVSSRHGTMSGIHCLLHPPLPWLQANPAQPRSWADWGQGIRKRQRHSPTLQITLLILLRKQTIALAAEIAGILRGRERGVKHMTAISFLHILNLVTKSTVPRGSLMSAKEGQLESSAALSLDH